MVNLKYCNPFSYQTISTLIFVIRYLTIVTEVFKALADDKDKANCNYPSLRLRRDDAVIHYNFKSYIHDKDH